MKCQLFDFLPSNKLTNKEFSPPQNSAVIEGKLNDGKHFYFKEIPSLSFKSDTKSMVLLSRLNTLIMYLPES